MERGRGWVLFCRYSSCLVLTVPTVPPLGSYPVNSSAAHGAKTAARVPSISDALPQAPAAAPSVAYTLDLCTNHLYSGNVLPTDCSGGSPFYVAYDSGKGEVFVVNIGGNVSVISDATNKVVATIPVGTDPEGVGYDLSNGYVYVSNYNQGTISIITTTNPAAPSTSNPTTRFLGHPGDDGYILIGVVAIILLTIAITVYVRRKRAPPPAPVSTAQTNLPEKLPQPPPGHTWLLTKVRNKPKQ